MTEQHVICSKMMNRSQALSNILCCKMINSSQALKTSEVITEKERNL